MTQTRLQRDTELALQQPLDQAIRQALRDNLTLSGAAGQLAVSVNTLKAWCRGYGIDAGVEIRRAKLEEVA